MAHQMGVCGCGKKRHWPKNSVVGDTWKCFNCGEVTTLATQGKKTRTVKSKKPPPVNTNNTNSMTNKPSSSNNASSSASNSCFPKGTRILTSRGSCDISKLTKGDFVVSVDNNNNYHQSLVFNVKHHIRKRLWLIEFTDGSAIKTTCNHTFYNGQTWVKSHKLVNGDKLFYSQGNSLTKKTVATSSETSQIEDVYNIYVEKNYNFIADGMLVHSFSKFRVVRIILWSAYLSIANMKLVNLKFSPKINNT